MQLNSARGIPTRTIRSVRVARSDTSSSLIAETITVESALKTKTGVPYSTEERTAISSTSFTIKSIISTVRSVNTGTSSVILTIVS